MGSASFFYQTNNIIMKITASENVLISLRCRTSLARSLQAIKPYAVQTEKIVICNASDNPVKLKHVYLLLNASMVGLCTLEAEVFRTLKVPFANSVLLSW